MRDDYEEKARRRRRDSEADDFDIPDERDEDEEDLEERPRRRKTSESRRRSEDEEDERPARRRPWEEEDEEEEDDESLRRARRLKKRQLGDRNMKVLKVVGIGALVVVAIVVIAILAWPKDRIGPFKAQMNDYLNAPAQEGLRPGVKLPGPVVVVSQKEKGLDDVHFKLKDALQAKAPDQVKVVVRVRWDKILVGTYNNGAPGYKHTCHVEVIDWSQKVIVARSEFHGGDPPQTTKNADKSGVFGSKPLKEAADFVTQVVQ
jgi:hypothetical protein